MLPMFFIVCNQLHSFRTFSKTRGQEDNVFVFEQIALRQIGLSIHTLYEFFVSDQVVDRGS